MRDVRDSKLWMDLCGDRNIRRFQGERKWATAVSIQAVIYFGARCRDHVDPGSFVRPAAVGGEDVLLPLNQQRHLLLLLHVLIIIPRPRGRQSQMHRYHQIRQFFPSTARTSQQQHVDGSQCHQPHPPFPLPQPRCEQSPATSAALRSPRGHAILAVFATSMTTPLIGRTLCDDDFPNIDGDDDVVGTEQKRVSPPPRIIDDDDLDTTTTWWQR
jgi:hypothetical protein